MVEVQPMAVDHLNEIAIMDASKIHLQDQNYNCCGISLDLYQFSNDPTKHWKQGHIFHATSIQDLSFEGTVEASDSNNKSEAAFRLHGANEENAVEDMIVRSLSLKHVGILRPFVAGYSTQISEVFSAFRPNIRTFDDWLKKEKEKESLTSIPTKVQVLIRTAYQAIMMIWEKGYTSDSLANACSYFMIDDGIKIDPLTIRRKNETDGDMSLRNAFGLMILQNIYPVWKDDELCDFVDLLNNPNAREIDDILGAPVLLLPASRELMYHNYSQASFQLKQHDWLQVHANPEAGWKENASNADESLRKIIEYQAHHGVGFSTDYEGALSFAKVVTAHYPQHFKDTTEDQSGVNVKDRVDLLLKQELPRLLTRRYNSEYLPFPDGYIYVQGGDQH